MQGWLKHIAGYRMAFSRWLWLVSATVVLLVSLSLLVSFHAAAQVPAGGILLGVMSITFVLVMTLLTVRYFHSIVHRVQSFASSVANGNFNTPLPRRRDQGEVADILHSLNVMQQRLRASFHELQSEEQSNALLVQAINQSSNSVMVTDLDARILYVNDAFVDNTGYARDEILGHTPKLIQSGKTAPAVYRQMRELLSAGETWRGELINKRKDGSEFIETVTISPVRDKDGDIYRFMAVKEDITEMRRAQDSIERLAYYDALTDLPNRRYFLDHLNRRIASSRRHQAPFALLFIDLNRFKEINDSQGHVVGDEVLAEVARRFASVTRKAEMLARLGGDEFVLLIDESEAGPIGEVVDRLLNELRDGVRIPQGKFEIGASVGVALYPRHGKDSTDLLRHADIAMYVAKESQSDMVVYQRSMSEKVERAVVIAARLSRALQTEDAGLTLHVQAQVDMRSGQLSGAEVLLRWYDEHIGFISPGDFIPVAEERGIIAMLDRFVIKRALMALAAWREQGLLCAAPLSINVSMALFEDLEFIPWLDTVLADCAVQGSEIELEITESGLMKSPRRALEVAQQLNARGIGLAIDDFGTGYSSLAYLKQFAASKVKIDQAFTRDLTKGERSQTIVKATISMVRELGMEVLAEGVETQAEADLLQGFGCHLAQGYLYAKPVPLSDFEAQWLSRF